MNRDNIEDGIHSSMTNKPDNFCNPKWNVDENTSALQYINEIDEFNKIEKSVNEMMNDDNNGVGIGEPRRKEDLLKYSKEEYNVQLNSEDDKFELDDIDEIEDFNKIEHLVDAMISDEQNSVVLHGTKTKEETTKCFNHEMDARLNKEDENPKFDYMDDVEDKNNVEELVDKIMLDNGNRIVFSEGTTNESGVQRCTKNCKTRLNTKGDNCDLNSVKETEGPQEDFNKIEQLDDDTLMEDESGTDRDKTTSKHQIVQVSGKEGNPQFNSEDDSCELIPIEGNPDVNEIGQMVDEVMLEADYGVSSGCKMTKDDATQSESPERNLQLNFDDDDCEYQSASETEEKNNVEKMIDEFMLKHENGIVPEGRNQKEMLQKTRQDANRELNAVDGNSALEVINETEIFNEIQYLGGESLLNDENTDVHTGTIMKDVTAKWNSQGSNLELNVKEGNFELQSIIETEGQNNVDRLMAEIMVNDDNGSAIDGTSTREELSKRGSEGGNAVLKNGRGNCELNPFLEDQDIFVLKNIENDMITEAEIEGVLDFENTKEDTTQKCGQNHSAQWSPGDDTGKMGTVKETGECNKDQQLNNEKVSENETASVLRRTKTEKEKEEAPYQEDNIQMDTENDKSDPDHLNGFPDFKKVERWIDEMAPYCEKGGVPGGITLIDKMMELPASEKKRTDEESGLHIDGPQPHDGPTSTSEDNYGTIPSVEHPQNEKQPIPKKWRLDNQRTSSGEENARKKVHQTEASRSCEPAFQTNNLKDKNGESADQALEHAMEQFYIHAYRWMAVRREDIDASKTDSTIVCREDFVRKDQKLNRNVVSKNDIKDLFVSHVKDGNLSCNNLRNSSIIQNLAHSFVSNKRFPYPCFLCGSFFVSKPAFDGHLTKQSRRKRRNT